MGMMAPEGKRVEGPTTRAEIEELELDAVLLKHMNSVQDLWSLLTKIHTELRIRFEAQKEQGDWSDPNHWGWVAYSLQGLLIELGKVAFFNASVHKNLTDQLETEGL